MRLASTLMDWGARIYPTHFGKKNAAVANPNGAFRKQAKHQPDITYLTPEVKADVKGLEDKVDWFRNPRADSPGGLQARWLLHAWAQEQGHRERPDVRPGPQGSKRARPRKSTARAKRSKPLPSD